MPSSDEYRLAGNAAFSKKDFDQALILYTLAIENYKGLTTQSDDAKSNSDVTLPPPASTSTTTPPATPPANPPAPPATSTSTSTTTPLDVHYANRSLAFSMTEDFAAAISDARESIRLSKGKNVKGYMRLVKGCAGCHLYAEAVEALEEGTALREEGDEERKELEVRAGEEET